MVFRPLLLVLPKRAERGARILLLKATHAPFVGIIWAYEHWQDYVWKKHVAERGTVGIETMVRGEAPATNGGLPSRPVKSTTRKSAVPASLVQASRRNAQSRQDGNVAVRSSTFGTGSSSSDAASASETMRLLKELSAQVEELRATVVKQQGTGQK